MQPTCIALPCVWVTLFCGGCPSFTVKILLSLTVTGFPIQGKGKKSRSAEMKIQPFQNCLLWVFNMIYMHGWYFIYVTPRLEFVIADTVNEFGTQLHKISNSFIFTVSSNSTYCQISLLSKQQWNDYLLSEDTQSIEFPSLVYRTESSYSNVYTVHIFNLMLVFQRPHSKFHLCHCHYYHYYCNT